MELLLPQIWIMALRPLLGTSQGSSSFRFRVPASVGRLLVPKGSIAVDGISLTLNERTSRSFSVAIIPFTLAHTNLQDRGVGDRVNLEADIIGKYVEKLVAGYAPGGSS